jgi:phage terminase large subunit-like protein
MTKPASLLAPDKIPKKTAELLRLIPGYDSIATAGDCLFDKKAATLALNFFPECLRHVEGDMAGKPFVLEPWQQSIVANLAGWKRKDELGRLVRRYRESLLYVPRKNGKTPWAAGLALFILFADSETGQQDYIAAADREQAGMLFRQAQGMVRQDPELESRCKIYGGNAAAGQSRSIVIEVKNSFLRIISADAKTKHGGTSHLVLVDELHAQPNRDLVDVLQTSMASANRKQPLMVLITTADFNRPSICNEKHEYACKVRDGIINDQAFLPVIYEASLESDWTDEKVWAAANPNLGVSVSLDYLRRECEKAKETPAYENTFKRLHLNIKTESDVRAIAMDKWNACGSPDPKWWRDSTIQRLRGRPCIGGLDLGITSDLTALALLFRDKSEEDDLEKFTVLPFYWVPRESAAKRTRRDRVPYETWINQGYIFPTEGDVTDYDKVRADINDLAGTFGIEELAVDRLFQGAQLCTQLMGDGITVIAFGQGFYSMASPTKRLLDIILAGDLAHGSNPVLRWNASNASTEQDAAGNLKFSKKKSVEKIDGLIALTMALGQMMARPEDEGIQMSIWENESE